MGRLSSDRTRQKPYPDPMQTSHLGARSSRPTAVLTSFQHIDSVSCVGGRREKGKCAIPEGFAISLQYSKHLVSPTHFNQHSALYYLVCSHVPCPTPSHITTRGPSKPAQIKYRSLVLDPLPVAKTTPIIPIIQLYPSINLKASRLVLYRPALFCAIHSHIAADFALERDPLWRRPIEAKVGASHKIVARRGRATCVLVDDGYGRRRWRRWRRRGWCCRRRAWCCRHLWR